MSCGGVKECSFVLYSEFFWLLQDFEDTGIMGKSLQGDQSQVLRRQWSEKERNPGRVLSASGIFSYLES